jgi:hypothetical protein
MKEANDESSSAIGCRVWRCSLTDSGTLSSTLILPSLGAVFNPTSHMTFHTSRENLSGADCFTFEEPGVRSEAEGFQEVGLHLR